MEICVAKIKAFKTIAKHSESRIKTYSYF